LIDCVLFDLVDKKYDQMLLMYYIECAAAKNYDDKFPVQITPKIEIPVWSSVNEYVTYYIEQNKNCFIKYRFL